MALPSLKWSLVLRVTITLQKYHGILNEAKSTVKYALLIAYIEMNP